MKNILQFDLLYFSFKIFHFWSFHITNSLNVDINLQFLNKAMHNVNKCYSNQYINDQEEVGHNGDIRQNV